MKKEAQPIIPEASQFVDEVFKRSRDETIHEKSYGHAMVTTAVILRERAGLGKTPEQQKEFLGRSARQLIEKFGPDILKVMREELKLVLTDEDLAEEPLIPDTIDPKVRPFVEEVHERISEPIIQKSTYGHAAANLAVGLREQARYHSLEEQRAFLRERAKRMIKKYGAKIIPFMREELRFSLSDEDLGISTK